MRFERSYDIMIGTGFGLAAVSFLFCYAVTLEWYWLVVSIGMIFCIFTHTKDPLKRTGIADVVVAILMNVVSLIPAFVFSKGNAKRMWCFVGLCIVAVVVYGIEYDCFFLRRIKRKK